MKKLLLSTTLLALTAGAALAADLPTRKEPLLPPPPPPPMWTGFYAGLNAGGTWTNAQATNFATAAFPPYLGLSDFGVSEWQNLAATGTGSVSNGSNGGFIGGGQIGYNYQFMGSFIVGLEADIQGVASGGSNGLFASALPTTSAGFNTTSLVSSSSTLDYLGTVRGRVGWLATPTLLLYGTGGLAYGGIQSSTAISQASAVPPVDVSNTFSSGTYSTTKTGWTAGGGVEWMFLPNWSAKAEYLYYNLGSVSYDGGFRVSLLDDGRPIYSHATVARTNFNGNIVRAGVNYHFNWGSAPVVASY